MKKTGQKEKWLLPDGVQEVVPPLGESLEILRRTVLDTMKSWGYQLVIPPGLEYLDSLLTGLGPDLNLQTFKLVDQITGKTLGIPADITPQIARIDFNINPSARISRYCYAGAVLHTLPDGFAGSRNPLQIGAELFGHEGPESDAEVITLLLEVLSVAGIEEPNLELGDMGLFRGICELANFDENQEELVLGSLLKKNVGEVKVLLSRFSIDEKVQDLLLSLLKLNGTAEVLTDAAKSFADGPVELQKAVESLEELVHLLRQRCPNLAIGIDLAELKGYRYHSSTTFSVYTPSAGRAIAWGGRYKVSNDSSLQREATGFSVDLRTLFSLGDISPNEQLVVVAPHSKEPDLHVAIDKLRAIGNVVVQSFPSVGVESIDKRSTKQLVKRKDEWVLEDI